MIQPKNSEIWLIRLKRKESILGIVISNNSLNKLPVRVVAPIKKLIDSNKKIELYYVPINLKNISTKNIIDCYQIKSIKVSQFVEKIGEISLKEKEEIDNYISSLLVL